ncbi:MAG: oxidative damage protection protein [Bdellovibrionales bacterium]|nr:oxidative damage protection protein [Bdellovibrionales bacterium]
MGERTVTCAKYGEELPGLDAAPFDGELGQQIYQNVSARAWNEWQSDLMIKVINEYRLNLADAEHYNVLLEQMKAFFNLGSGDVLEVENAERGK